MANDPQSDRFFVGYLPMPRGLGGRVLGIAAGLTLWALASAGVWLSTARDPGTGTWDTSRTVELVGLLRAEPYPMLEGVVWNGEALGSVLLVSEGKIGAQDRLGDAAGRAALAKGYLIRRGELAMLELVGGFGAVQRSESDFETAEARPSTTIEPVTLRGEIVDPKCYLGVMKPGAGRTHKACAALCILGGIPPMFVVRAPGGEENAYLLLGEDGRALPRGTVSDLAGEPVVAHGRLQRVGGLAVFLARLETIKPLGARPIALNSSN